MKIAIAGYGVEGKASYNYFRQAGHEAVIVDERPLNPFELPYGVNPILGKNAFRKLSGFDMVIRSAGIAPRKIKTNGKMWSATNEFFSKCPAPIIGVTGTKGKGTTASLIAGILKAAGKTVHLVGNIGVPALGALPHVNAEDIVVYELSSFQLWDLEKSPHVAVVLMIERDHLDVHKDMKEYVTAKSQIRRHQGDDDICIYHPNNQYSFRIASSTKKGKLMRYSVPDDGGVYVKTNTFFARNVPLCSTDKLKIPGTHNLDNACAAITAALEYTDNNNAITAGLSAFEGLPHRLKFVREVNGVRYYDDSIATTPGSAIAAIHAIEGPKVLILGGYDKGADYKELLTLCHETETQVLAIGAIRERLAKQCKRQDVACTVSDAQTMTAIVKHSTRLLSMGGSVLLSPAAASFDMFKSYADRGDQFIKAVEILS